MSMSERGATWVTSAGSPIASPVTPKLVVSTTMAVARSRVPNDVGRSAGRGFSSSRACAIASAPEAEFGGGASGSEEGTGDVTR